MSRPTNSNKKFAKNSTELRQLIADTDLEVISQRVRYVEKAGEMKTLSRKLQSQLEIQIGLEAKIAQDKKELERTRREILKQEQVLKGHKGVEGYAETKRKEYLTQLLISDASLAVSEEKNRAAAEKEGADLVRIYNEFNNRTTRGTIAKQEDRNKAAACVLQLKEFVTSFKPIVNPKKDALVAYLRSLTPPQNDAANSINAQGYIANQTQRNDVSRALDALQTQVTNPSPRTTIAAPNLLPAEGIAILTAILQDEINKLTVTKNAAETERNQILTRSLVLTLPAAKTIVDEEKKRVTAVNVKKKDYEERAKELRDKAITDLDKTSPGLFDRLQARANAATEVVSIIDAKINQVFEILHDVKAGKEITEVNKNAEALHILSSLFLANTVTGVTNIDNAENLLKNKLKTIIKIRNNLLAGVAINGAEKDEAKRILASKPALFTEIDLNGTIPSLLNALNGSDYEIVSLAKEYDSIREKADLEKTKVESDIATKDRQRTIDINTGADPSVVNLMEDSIAEKQFELGGVEEKINYLKKLKKESESSNQIERSNQIKAQITKLYAEYNSSVEEQNKLKSEETECDFEIISQEIILQTKRLDKSSITSAEASGLTRDNALELREKAIKAQRTALGEVAVKELAEKWKSDSEAIAREREAPINVFNTAAADAETQRDAQLVAIAANPADLDLAKTQITAAAYAANQRDAQLVAIAANPADLNSAKTQITAAAYAANQRDAQLVAIAANPADLNSAKTQITAAADAETQRDAQLVAIAANPADLNSAKTQITAAADAETQRDAQLVAIAANPADLNSAKTQITAAADAETQRDAQLVAIAANPADLNSAKTQITAAADAETQRDAQLVAIAANPADLNSAKTQITAAANILNNVHLNHLNDASIMEALDHHRNGRVAQRDAILDRSGDTGRPQRNSYWFSNPAVTQIELLSAAYAHTALTGVLDKNQAIVQQRAYNDAYNNAVLGRVSVAQKNAAIAQQRAYNDAYNNAVLGRVNDTQKNAAIAQQRAYNDAYNNAVLGRVNVTQKNAAIAQQRAYNDAYNNAVLGRVNDTQKNAAIAQQRAYNDAYNNAVLGRVNDTQKNAAIAQQRAYNDAYNNAVLGRVNDTQKDEAIAQQGRYVAAKESLSNLALVNNFGEIADKFFIYGGYTEVKAFWDRQNNNTKSNEAKRLKEAAELEVAKNLGLIKEETTKKELLETELSKLEKEIAAAQKDVDNKTDLGSDVTEEEKNSLLRLKHSKSTTKASIDTKATKIDNLKSALTLNLMKVGGQNLIAKNADKAIQNAALEARNQAILEEAEYKKFLVLENASQANELRIEKQLSLYDIDYSITDEGKKLEITKTEESNGVASTVLLDSLVGDDKKRVELASEVVESLFSLNNDSNREMDLVPELRSSKRIQARPNSDGAEIFVVFDDPAQASAFCYKMNKFTKINEVTKETKPIIDPEASFVTGFDSYGNSKNESQQVLWKKKKIGEELPIINKRFKIPEFEINTGYQAPKFEDKSKPDLDGKYVVSITVGREYDTSITFVDDILNSDRARTLQDRVKNANRAERVIEKKDEGVKTALSVVANLTIVGPGLVGALASGLRWITEPAAKLGVPGSGILSAINQSMYDFAAATTKRGNPFGLVAPNKMEQLSNKFAKASDDLQKIQEKNIAKGLFHWDSKNPLKSFFRPFENITMTVARIGFGIPAVISKGTSLLAHGVGDYLINASKYCSKTADAQWNQGSPNPLYFGVLYGTSAVSGVIGLASRTVGVITGGVGEALSKPCKAVNPEGGAASNRSKLGLGFGALIRKIDRGLYDIRNYLFASKEATETSLNLSAAGKMDSAEIKQKADSSQIKEKFNFDALIQAIALDTENPKFNQSSGIEGDNKKYMKVAQVSYNNNKYKVLLGVDGNVVITESGISKSGIPDSLSGRLPSFFAEVLEVVAKTRKSEEEASTSYLTRSTTGITMREFGEKFGGISSSSSCAGASESINEGEVLRGYLSTLKKKQYVVNKIQDVAGYSVKVDENDHIHIGKKGEELKEIEEGKASTNLALFEVVSELSKGKNKKNKHNSSESSNSSGSSNLPEGSVDISGIDVVENLKGERYPTNGKRNDRRVRRR